MGVGSDDERAKGDKEMRQFTLKSVHRGKTQTRLIEGYPSYEGLNLARSLKAEDPETAAEELDAYCEAIKFIMNSRAECWTKGYIELIDDKGNVLETMPAKE